MSKKSYREAINEAIAQEMRRDENVLVWGEDNVGGTGGDGEQDAWGGVLGVTKGLYPEFGPDRVMDTPISESAFIGAAAGAAATGLRPVAELMFVDFMGVCFDQIFNQASRQWSSAPCTVPAFEQPANTVRHCTRFSLTCPV